SESEGARIRDKISMVNSIDSLTNGMILSDDLVIEDRSVPSSVSDPEEIVPTPRASSCSDMWNPRVSERQLSLSEVRRGFGSGFGMLNVYPGTIDPRSAALQMLISAAREKPVLGPMPHDMLARHSMVLHTRAMEDDLLRTPLSSERACRHESSCKIYQHFGQIGRECLHPSELLELERSGKFPEQRRPCLGCMRYDVTYFWMGVRQSGEPVGNIFISGHYNMVNILGEYVLEQTIFGADYGLPLPVVPFIPGSLQLSKSRLNNEDVYYFRQTGMAPAEDFP
ncbi:MAG TPA: hypothetical protein VJ044_15255, partial [Candidatus Hodarchaeales archaeon]|nr:hypothetical protein [Candidatus Hodarchaeales archaeon]